MDLNLSQLRDYRHWVDKNALTIRDNVLLNGGWASVFPPGRKLPRWASRVRNYFNVTPSRLTRLQPEVERKLVRAVQPLKLALECEEERKRQEDRKWDRTPEDRRRNPYNKPNPTPIRLPAHCRGATPEDTKIVKDFDSLDALKINHTLQGAVYKDETGRFWYQMTAAATIYHYGDTPSNWLEEKADGAYVAIKGQSRTPVFKLISPDRTGGSVEVILWNLYKEDTLLQAGGATLVIGVSRLVSHPIYQGSYNYSDPMTVGPSAHELRDVKSHVASSSFYLNPPFRYSPLQHRIFFEKDPRDPSGIPLAEQV